MKKIILISSLCVFLASCGSSFNSFYNSHKSDLGTTSFQVPKFMKAIVGSISPEINQAIGNISDFKLLLSTQVLNITSLYPLVFGRDAQP